MHEENDFKILTAPPEWQDAICYRDWESRNWLSLKSKGISECLSSRGQTLYACINFEFEIIALNTLKLTYLESPAIAEGLVFKGFTPTESNSTKEITYRLVENGFNDERHWINKQHWALTLDESPFPEGIYVPEHNFEYVYFPKD